ncbi:hypothetical protein IMSAGC007_03676 [Lachnospiraceae bacterium]|nr:hypothetical protein IMSAGC007_03676 [Lachnospiraceae bacterium]
MGGFFGMLFAEDYVAVVGHGYAFVVFDPAVGWVHSDPEGGFLGWDVCVSDDGADFEGF